MLDISKQESKEILLKLGMSNEFIETLALKQKNGERITKFVKFVDINGKERLVNMPDSPEEIEEKERLHKEYEERKRLHKDVRKIKSVEILKRQEEYINKFIKEHPSCDKNLIWRFFSKVNIKGEDECWEWLNCTNSGKYGLFNYQNKPCLSHRISYIIYHESILNNMDVLHRCDNTFCVNPNHLFLGTQIDNMIDRTNKNRGYIPSGEKNKWAKYTWKEIKEIRKDSINGMSAYEICGKYKIPLTTVYYITNNKSWIDNNYIPFRVYSGCNKGETNPNSKLTQKNVNDIREKYNNGRKIISLAKEYNVHRMTISDIVHFKVWK